MLIQLTLLSTCYVSSTKLSGFARFLTSQGLSVTVYAESTYLNLQSQEI